MILTPGLTLYLAGIGTVLLGWLLFRRPGVAFWTWAPIWEGKHYLKPPGVVLWAIGCVVTWVGIGLLVARWLA